MPDKQYARGLWAQFAPSERPFDVPNGMEDNLRLIDDHLGLYTLSAPTLVGAGLPLVPADGDGQIFTDGTYATFNGGSWRNYPPRKGLRAVLVSGTESWLNTGDGWEKYSTLDTAPAIAAAQAAIQPLVVEAQSARDGALAATNLRASKEQAMADPTIPNGGGFTAPGPDGTLQAYIKNSSSSVTPIGSPSASAARVAALEQAVRKNDSLEDDTVYAIADENGNTPFRINRGGDVAVPRLRPDRVIVGGAELIAEGSAQFVFVIMDEFGNVGFGVDANGKVYPDSTAGAVVASPWSELVIGLDDSIIHGGDSYTASHYAPKDKSYLGHLSALSPYRHINYGVSGNDALDVQYRAVHETPTFGATLQATRARYAFLTTLTNDGQFRTVDLTYYAENMRRLIETVRAVGTEPVVTTEFPATAAEHALLRRIAEETGCGFIDCTSYNTEVGGLVPNPFHQGHPGQRTNGVFWLPMLDYIDRMPKPSRAIKIFRRRVGFAVSAISDLLYTGRIDRSAKWKELTLGHYSITPSRAEELSQLGEFGVDWNYDVWDDEYLKLANGGSVPIADYVLFEVTLPGVASSLEAVELTLGASAAAQVYARDFLDTAASMPGRTQGSTPTDATYLSKWNKPRGAWRNLGAYSAPIVIPAADLRRSMQGNTLVIMVAGTFNLTNLKIRYKGRDLRSDLRMTARAAAIGAQLIAQPLCGTTAQLATWTVAGSPSLVIPIDLPNAPRKPAVNAPVDGVVVISAADTIGKTVALPAETGALRRFRITVWARYFPKAFLDPAKYPTLDAAQIVNRITTPAGATITPDTHDLRTVKCEIWEGAAYPTWGGAEFFDFAPLFWRPIEFVFELQPYKATSLSFRLSCPDGEVQVAKVFFQEIAV